MHVKLCGDCVEVNTHFDVNSSKRTCFDVLKPSLQQDIHLFAFLKINDIDRDKVSLLFKIFINASLNSQESGGKSTLSVSNF